ncbi:hypothetical protein SAMN05216262_11940 [Colwellia chukchiensis]|uniref:Peptidogalycan biosysnthesis/recognition n=1 Tax=Colwellia chukchiensis TaxID=641665 RepID=A0A1H7SKI3_9GAMM|nr:GNAT family N-acetyltransferase [Colwellia chukchiensis]SEL73023.1 hypothetical protein SAMN05216262_11940 [Colwellia chukchiensis]
MKTEIITNIANISTLDWQRLNPSASIFSNYQLFQCLETSGSVSDKQGWQPQHLQIRDQNNRVAAILPMYIKTHSWGEYVFDWAWADAYQRHHLPYYPKLVATTPFTPVTSHKLLSHTVTEADVFECLTQQCQQQGLSSWHILYCPEIAQTPEQVYQRNTVQFHWLNYHYRDFEDFLSRFNARKRKNTRKERQSIAKQNISIRRVLGADISEKELAFFYLTYQLTYLRRGHQPHLSFAFFQSMVKALPEHILLIIASLDGEDIACAWFFYDHNHLYGRYWGCTKSYKNLHFELCYYQGIEFCIDHKLTLFHPGTQGEHKIARGFEPTLTHSYHWVQHAEFKAPIKAFCLQEQQQMRQYQLQCQQLLPFKVTPGNK